VSFQTFAWVSENHKFSSPTTTEDKLVGLLRPCIRRCSTLSLSSRLSYYSQLNLRLHPEISMLGPVRPVPLNLKDTYFDVFHSMHSHNILNTLIIPNKCTTFIRYIHLLYFSYEYLHPCYIHHHQGDLSWPLLKTVCCYVAINYGLIIVTS